MDDAGRFVAICCVLVAIGAIASRSWAGIVGSGHDFSAQGWSGNKICKPCHTPHNGDTSVPPPLWNHQLTTATYQVYTSDTLDDTPDQPGVASLLCLSCHDGTVALDSYGGTTGSVTITGNALIGTDLRDDHPIGVAAMPTGDTNANCSSCHVGLHGNPSQYPSPSSFGDDGYTSPAPFFSGKVECLSCHEPHNAGPDPAYAMMRMSMAGSTLCLHCHNK